MEENSWRGLVLAWANRLNLTSQPAQQMIDFTDGKFFAEFMAKHLPSWNAKGQTSTETFSELEVRIYQKKLFQTSNLPFGRHYAKFQFLVIGWLQERVHHLLSCEHSSCNGRPRGRVGEGPHAAHVSWHCQAP